MKVKLPPFPGTNCILGFLTTAWSTPRIELNREIFLACGSACGRFQVWRIVALPENLIVKCATNLPLGTDEEEVGAICFDPTQEGELMKCFASCGRKIFSLELKKTSTGCSANVQQRGIFNEDEVTMMAVTPDGTMLAASDDSGEIKLIQLQPDIKVYRTLRKHTTVCPSFLFRPGRRSSIISCGLDSTIIIWEDVVRCRVGQVIKMQDVAKVANAKRAAALGRDGEDLTCPYVVNPALVHCVTASPNGAYLAAGVQDASIQIFDASKKTVIYQAAAPYEIHTKAVCQLLFLTDSYLLSGANDGLIILWRLEDKIAEFTPSPTVASHPFESDLKRPGRRQKSGKRGGAGEARAQQRPRLVRETSLTPVKTIVHCDAVNWLSVVQILETVKYGDEENGNEPERPEYLVAVADSTADIVIYKV